jgi:head-tail adaptor
MIAGRLDRQISVLRKALTLSASGEAIEAWSPVVERLAASMLPLKGEERFTGEQYVASEQTEFRVRWRAELVTLSPLDRIVEPALAAADYSTSPPGLLLEASIADRRQYDVMAVHELGRREGLRILAARRVDHIRIDPPNTDQITPGGDDDVLLLANGGDGLLLVSNDDFLKLAGQHG